MSKDNLLYRSIAQRNRDLEAVVISNKNSDHEALDYFLKVFKYEFL